MGKMIYLLLVDRLLRCLCEFLDSLLVMTKILLASNKDHGEAVAEVNNLGNPLQI